MLMRQCDQGGSILTRITNCSTNRSYQRHIDTVINVYTNWVSVIQAHLTEQHKMRRSLFLCRQVLWETSRLTSRCGRLLHTSTDGHSTLKSTNKPASPSRHTLSAKRNQGTSTTSGFYDSNSAFQWQPGSEPGIDTSADGVVSHGKTFPVNTTRENDPDSETNLSNSRK